MALTYPRVLPVGDRAVTVELGGSLNEETVGRVRALDACLSERAIPGILETVPTYAALMVIYDRERIALTDLQREVAELCVNLGTSSAPGRRIEVPTVYDGEDLDEIATLAGLSRDAVVDLHSARDYTVMMLGFSPGFAYMGFVDERIRFPRRKTPRTRVPAGSVAIASPQTGIYPRSLPGGWNLLGRSTITLFDASARPSDQRPSLLMPGDQVRFHPTTLLEERVPSPEVAYDGDGVEILEAGILTTIQDGGRRGLRRVAVPWTGFADATAARRANKLVGNPADAAVIELCGAGLSLSFESTTFVAITGVATDAELERSDLSERRSPVPPNVAVRVRPGNRFSVPRLDGGARAYVAIAGLEAPRVLGSASTDLGSDFLRPLRTGDRLSISAFGGDSAVREVQRVPPRGNTVRVVLGPQAHHFEDATITAFLQATWRVGLDSDRVGARLDGQRLTHLGPAEIISDGMVPGCIQVPPDGRPIVMLSDCPTTGGYPKIACVVSDDLGIVAQAIPGATELRFVAVRVEDL